MRITIPFRLLFITGLSVAVPASVGSAVSISGERYPEPNVVNAHLGEMLALVLPVAAISTALVAVHFLAPGLLWHRPEERRGTAAVVRDASALAMVAGVGCAVGFLPLLVWSCAYASSGPSPLPWWVLAAVIVTSSTLLVTAAVRIFPTAWVGVGFAAMWVLLFYRAKIMLGAGGELPSTRLAFVPFAGTNVGLGADLQVNGRVLLLRGAMALAVTGCSLALLSRGNVSGPLVDRVHAALSPVPILALIALTVGLSFRPVPLLAEPAPHFECDAGRPRVCLFPSHESDRSTVRQVYSTIHAFSGDVLLAPNAVSEDPRARDRSSIVITLRTSTLNSPRSEVAGSLGAAVARVDYCLSARRPPDQVLAAQTVGEWLASQADPERVREQGPVAPTLKRWSADPEKARAALQSQAAKVTSCRLRLSDMP